MASAPSSSSVRPATSIPISATTPASPSSRPASRAPVARSSASKRSASRATNSGAAATMIAASDELTCCSPAAISGNGNVISTRPKTAIQRQRPRSEASVPARQASPSSTAAPSTIRTHASSAGGTPSSTATLMNRYGMPHRVETAAKAIQARALMPGK